MESYPRDEAFAVIRLDPVASVRHLKDPEALRAARALTPGTYVVYLFEVRFPIARCYKLETD